MDRIVRICLRVLLAAAGVAVGITTASASTLSVRPVTITLHAGQPNTTLTLSNPGQQPLSFQVRAFAWSQQNGVDRLVPTPHLQLSPPLGTIAPGTQQVVRLVLQQPPTQQEASYRLLVDQLPPANAPGRVSIALRLSLPVFAEPAARGTARLQWRVTDTAGRLQVTVSNHGIRHAKIRNLVLLTRDGKILKPAGGSFAYVLAHSTHRFHFRTLGALPAPGSQLRLHAETDQGPIDLEEPLTAGP
jgi:fimbrial chaperone protein